MKMNGFGLMVPVFILMSILLVSDASAYIFVGSPSVPDSVRLSLNAAGSTANILAVDVLADRVSNVYSAAFDVNFNSNVLEWVGTYVNDPNGYDKGDFFGSSAIYAIGNEISATGITNRNKLVAGVISASGSKTGSGKIMTIKFRIVGGGTTAVSFSNNNLIRPDLSFTSSIWYGGTFTSDAAAPPQRSNGSPTGILPAGTTQTTVSLVTNENANCRYSATPGISYASMTGMFTTTGGTYHSVIRYNLANGQTYNFYVRCIDTTGSANTDDYLISFSVGLSPHITPPQRSNGQPSGMLAAGTTQAALSLTTDENAVCRYSAVPGTAYAFMTVFATTGGMFHSVTVTGLQNGQAYNYYAKCIDSAGNANTDDYAISFSIGTGAIAHAPVFNSILISPANPTPSQPLTCTVSVSDADGNLNNVNFKWYINGVRVWDTNRLVSGSSATASDTYSGTKIMNDYIVCEAKAYDSTGAYATTNHAVRVGTVSNSLPQISYVDITPRHPNPQQDLTCSVFATDADDNLDHVIFEWFVNSVMIRSADKWIADGMASDLLDASRVRQGDMVKCRAHVYDANGAEDSRDSAAVTIGTAYYPPYYPPYQPQPPYYGQNQKPVAVLNANKQYINRNETVFFSGTGSYDPDGTVIQYQFDYGDGHASAWLPDSTPYAFHSYQMPGTYYARLRVKDDQYNESAWSTAVAVQVREQQQPQLPGQRPLAVLSANRQAVDADETILFSGSGSYDPDGGPIALYNFDFGDGGQSGWVPNLTVRHSYSDDGVYYARLMARDDEGDESLWSFPVIIRVGESGTGSNAPVIDDMRLIKEPESNYVRFRCEVEAFDRNGDLDYVRFKWYFSGELFFTEREEIEGRNDETYSEISIQTTADDSIRCEATVYDQNHNYASAERIAGGSAAPGPVTGCGLEAKRFDYITYIMEGMKGWTEMEVENTGASGTLTIRLYVDGSQKDQYSTHLSASGRAAKRFEFPLSVGAHKIRVESSMACGAKLNKTTEITVFPLTSSAFVPSGPGGGGATEITETRVRITPASLDIEINKGNVVAVYIESPVQAKFNISVSGLPEDWTNYQKEVDVKGGATAFVYIVPKTIGNYNFKVTVKTGNRTFEQGIALYVAPAAKQESGMGPGTGLVGALQSNWLIGAAIFAVLVLLTAMYFIAGRMKKKTYEEHVYGPRKPPYYGPYGPSSGSRTPQPGMSLPRQQAQPQRAVSAGANKMHAPKPAPVPAQAAPLESHIAEYRHPHELRQPERLRNYMDGNEYPKYGSDFAKLPDHPFVHKA